MAELCCPFCGYKSESDYGIMYHLESLHPEGESPFMLKDDSDHQRLSGEQHTVNTDHEDLQYVDCLREDCGEIILLTELESHMSMHDVETQEGKGLCDQQASSNKRTRDARSESEVLFDTRLPPAIRNLQARDAPTPGSSPDRQASAKAGWRVLLNMPGSRHKAGAASGSTRPHRRLGKSELGPYAHERQMPNWLRQLLETDGKTRCADELSQTGRLSKVRIAQNHISGILPVIEKLLDQDPKTQYAYTCHPCVYHISKLQNEGGFCGYRNIQMLASYIIGTRSQGFHHFDGNLPSIFQIQDFIEHAWDIGINAHGRLETGGIRGTRKYIGTPEAQAMLVSLNITCNAQGLKSTDNMRADHLLLQYVEEYYSAGQSSLVGKVRSTTLAPLYFQHPGHSMTIVGVEKKTDGNLNLLVFDPMFHDSMDVVELINQDFVVKVPANLLRAYRRSANYLRKYNEFEVLRQVILSWGDRDADFLRLTPPNILSQPLT